MFFFIKILFLISLILFPFQENSYAYDGYVTSYTSWYKKELRRYTQKNELYSMKEWDAYYKWYATYHSPEYMKAFDRLFDHYYPNGQNALAQKFRDNMEAREKVEFFVALYSKDRAMKTLGGKRNLWNLALKANGHTYHPLKIKEITLTPFQSRFYPYVDRRYRGFRVVYPLKPEDLTGQKFILELSSVAGVSRLKYKNK